MLGTDRITTKRSETAHLWIEYSIRGRPSLFNPFLANSRLRLVLGRTGCHIDVQSEAGSGRRSSDCSGERSVIRIVGPTSEAIAEVNATLDEVNSRYRRRTFRSSHPSLTSLQVDVHQVMLSYCKTLNSIVYPSDIDTNSQSRCGPCAKVSQANDATSLFHSVFNRTNHGIQMIDKKSLPSASITFRQDFCQSAPGIRQSRGSSNGEVSEFPRLDIASSTESHCHREMPSQTQKDHRRAYCVKKQSKVGKTRIGEDRPCTRMKANAGDSVSDLNPAQSPGCSFDISNNPPTQINLHESGRKSTSRFVSYRHLPTVNSFNGPSYSATTGDGVNLDLDNIDRMLLQALIHEVAKNESLSFNLPVQNVGILRDADIETLSRTAQESLQQEPELSYSTLSEINSLASCVSGNIKFRKSVKRLSHRGQMFTDDDISDSSDEKDIWYNPSRSSLRLAQKIKKLINTIHPDIVRAHNQVKTAYLFTETDKESCHSLHILNPTESVNLIVVTNQPLRFLSKMENQMQFPVVLATISVIYRIHDKTKCFAFSLESLQFHEHSSPFSLLYYNFCEIQMTSIAGVPPSKLPTTDLGFRPVHKDVIVLHKIQKHIIEKATDLSTVGTCTFIGNGVTSTDNLLLLSKQPTFVDDVILSTKSACHESTQREEVDMNERPLTKPVKVSLTPSPRPSIRKSQERSPTPRLSLSQPNNRVTAQSLSYAQHPVKRTTTEPPPLPTSFSAQLSQLLKEDNMHQNRKVLRRLINLTSKHNSILKAIHSRLSAMVEPRTVQKQSPIERKLNTRLLQPCHKLTTVASHINSAPASRSSRSTGSSPDQSERMRQKGHYYTVSENKVFDHLGGLVGTLGFNSSGWSDKSKNMYPSQHKQVGYTMPQPAADSAIPIHQVHYAKSMANPVAKTLPPTPLIHSNAVVCPPRGLHNLNPNINVRHHRQYHLAQSGALRHPLNVSPCKRDVHYHCLSHCHHGCRSKSIPPHSAVEHRTPMQQTNRVAHLTPSFYPGGYPCPSY